ncbi:MAG: glycosyltransferase [Candidatus Omnitrophica bacterium CG11_big_fil_rev_8_21_14_0_20_45_26]|uniref:Glycosyltransferase n=1 Tax=Candidatus Abzuiibacterium crystallinum TaxID=1974748 RepID=A0A2H0LPA2_9BACT|nr:MAG: glycosyltransferase [Candidatus Omnitrophica bacterium CG11_big_fil_rev_8_21_14_0_20_45_26]PIW63217.1 MAG: glycosyltransferase [Candidatus Omnitrophica bacterium CG12_big_fil_rev_8_21_14_0_65_45_16]
MNISSLSIVIPVYNEAASLAELHAELSETLRDLNVLYEIIFVDDGSTDNSMAQFKKLQMQDPHVKWVKFRSRFGKSAALAAGFKMTKGSAVLTLDGDLQDNPSEIPRFLERLQEGFDVVSGWKHKRKDPLSRRILSRIYNGVTAIMSGIKLHDFNCGMKAYRREVLQEIHLYGELHRYIPILAAWRGFRITEQRVIHRPRKYGKSKYGVSRLMSGCLDLFTVVFLTKFTKKPSHFFGTIGIFLTLSGFVIDCYILYLRLLHGNIQNRYPLLFLGVLLTIVGIQFFSTGLIAEMITFGQNKSDLEYSIHEQSS